MRRDAVCRVVAGVLAAATRDAEVERLVLLHDGSAQAELAADCCRKAVGRERVRSVPRPPADAAMRWARMAADAEGDAAPAGPAVVDEAHRFRARILAARLNALVVHPANKTVLLLARATPVEWLLPLGDLYASDVRALAGDCTLPTDIRELAGEAGGVEGLDAVLARLIDERRAPEEALAELPAAVRGRLLERLERGRFGRRRIGLVPKLGRRTLGTDLFA